MKLTRRAIMTAATAVVVAGLPLRWISVAAQEAGDPLPSWNDGPAKQAIVEFVQATTDQSSPKFVPPEQRIATFDQDGTLWVEHPMYTQVDLLPGSGAGAGRRRSPSCKTSSRSRPCCPATAKRSRSSPMPDLEKILAATLTGMTVDEFNAEVKKWLADAPRTRAGSARTPSSTYQPMQEVLKYLRANGYKTYIVTGGGQDFVRVYAEQVYGIPPEQVVGTAGGDEVRLRQGRQADPDQGAEAAAERQQRRQARGHPPHDRPPARTPRSATRPATGRCWSTRRPATARGSGCWCCTTTPKREYAYGPGQGLPDTKVGAFTAGALRRGEDRRAGRSSA